MKKEAKSFFFLWFDEHDFILMVKCEKYLFPDSSKWIVNRIEKYNKEWEGGHRIEHSVSAWIDIILHFVISFIRALEGFDKFVWKLKSEGKNGNGFNQEKEQNILNK